jgi:2-keto-3-deoxy-L-rhamnonate aldolase RhmA
MTGQLPLFSLSAQQPETIIRESNSTGSTVILMIETADSINNIDEIAQVPGVDLLLIGSNDLSIELGIPCQFESSVFGLAGIYDRKDIHDFAVNKLGARFILGQQDSGVLAKGAKACATTLQGVQTE